ncbi:uncharacterized protein LTR77_009140 [Saxophila tyrrhenica]|uniref:Kelch repeat protein n=1 Tax=Saxophila tyrrhenica TaxID=1690608 RepID=A0AAV9NZL2_9PEZI|nr:hypothetical protein LTR77_009140 [Saxophila tyrrhenica]
MALTAHWTKVGQNNLLKRSSVCASVIGSTIYVFGGELEPRKPRDNDVHKVRISLDGGSAVETTFAQTSSPSPRVGATTTSLNGKLYMFSGRGGEAMAPIEENGHVWAFDPSIEVWTSLRRSSSVYPEARSYHAMTNNGSDTIYVHAGCPEAGRLSDLWAFNVHDSKWRQLATAPGADRGGSSIAYDDGKIYRMNGFDGKTEKGGALDVFDEATNNWSSFDFLPDGKSGPGARSVAALIPVHRDGRVFLVTLFGESDPSSLGHLGAGKMLNDSWAYSVHDETWIMVNVPSTEGPQARGWFDADVVSIGGEESVVVVGGLGESNERLDDAWLLRFSVSPIE